MAILFFFSYRFKSDLPYVLLVYIKQFTGVKGSLINKPYFIGKKNALDIFTLCEVRSKAVCMCR